jgi:glyoxylase-like metal-dependent hydrolase (beta-lactamase superfamily II)
LKPSSCNIVEILEDLFFVERGYLNANHLVYRGPAPVLIDTAYSADLAETLAVLDYLGVQPAGIHTVVTTHNHCDHVGGHRHLQEVSGCRILQHELGRIFIESRDDWATWWRYYNQQAEFFHSSAGLADGDTVDIGPHRFEVLHTPGHAADGIVLYHRDAKLLISSDTLWEKDLAVHTVRIEGSAAVYQTRKSLDRLADLAVETVCPGHGPIFDSYEEARQRSLQRVDGYLRDRRKIGLDVVKKLTVYTLLMAGCRPAERFFEELMETVWFRETVDFYFDGNYRCTYRQIMDGFLQNGIVVQKGENFYTTVKP